MHGGTGGVPENSEPLTRREGGGCLSMVSISCSMWADDFDK
jgi:hypothetical protein